MYDSERLSGTVWFFFVCVCVLPESFLGGWGLNLEKGVDKILS